MALCFSLVVDNTMIMPTLVTLEYEAAVLPAHTLFTPTVEDASS